MKPLPKYDRAGRLQKDPENPFRGIGVLTRTAELIPNKLVPPEYWALDGEEAIVCCPCSNTPAVALLEAPIPCGCGRWFAFDSQNVWVFGFEGMETDETT